MAAQNDDLPVGALTVIGLASLLVTLVTVILLVGLYRNGEEREFDRKVVQAPFPEVESSRKEARSHLDSYGWVDREAGQVHIPIERAMGLVLKEQAPR